MARPRPSLVTLSQAAADRIAEILAAGSHAYLRVGIKNGGCAGMEYTMSYTDTRGPLDELVEDKGVQILVDAKAVLFLVGTQIDFEVTRMAARFTFRNPNETDACGCGESVTIIPAEAV